MFEGIPTYPDVGRLWQVVEKHKVNIFHTDTPILPLGLRYATPRGRIGVAIRTIERGRASITMSH